MSKKKITYSNSIDELEAIIKEINENKISIDHLQDKVKRAKELVEWCSNKLRTTQSEIENT